MHVYRLPAPGERVLRALIKRYRAHDAVPVPIQQIAEQEGWEIEFRSDLGKLLGVSGIYRGIKLMWIHAELPTVERRAVIAHELGHWINGDEQVIRACQWSSFFYRWDERLERQASTAAARLLIPAWAVREFRTVDAIAAACQVPQWLVQFAYEPGPPMTASRFAR